MSRAITITSPSGVTLKTKEKYVDDDIAVQVGDAENIVAGNIKSGVTILGVSGTLLEPSGTVNITENGVYDVGSYASASVNLPMPSGTLEITGNGTYDVGSYASASVNVSGDYPYADFDMLIGGIGSVYSGYCPSVIATSFMASNAVITDFNPYFSSDWSVITLRNSAFYGCPNLTQVNFFSSVVQKKINQFGNLNAYSGALINFIPSSSYMHLFNMKMANLFSTTLNSVPNFQEINITNLGVSKVQIDANNTQVYLKISGCSSLTSILISNQVSTLISNYYALGYNTAISYIEMSKVHLLGSPYYIFVNDTSLEKVKMDVTTAIYTTWAWFSSCYKLSSIEFLYNGSPYTSTIVLRSQTFRECSALTSLPFKLEVSYNASEVFRGAGIRSIYYSDPNLVNFTTVTSYCFYGCLSLKYVSSPRINTISSYGFAGCTSLSYVNIWGNGCSINRLFQEAFRGCTALTSIMFGMDTSYHGGSCVIYPSAFYGCTSLSKVYIPHWSQASNIHVLNNINVFENTPLSDSSILGYYGSIYVPESLYSSYISATNWAAYSDRFVSVTDAEMEQIITDYNAVQYTEPEE